MSTSTEDLLKLLEEAENKTSPSNEERPVDYTISGFIKKNELIQGQMRYPTFLVYYLYCQYCGTVGKNRLSKIEFGRQFSKSFNKGRTGKQRYYFLNSKLPKDKLLIEKARRHEQNWQNKTKKEKSKKSN